MKKEKNRSRVYYRLNPASPLLGNLAGIIEKQGKPMAALVSVQELQRIEGSKEKEKRKGLLASIGAWEDFEDLESTVSAIYERRKKSKDRSAGGLV